MQVLLLRALRTTIRADSDPGRQLLFASLKRENLAVRWAAALHARLGKSWAATLFVACYGLRTYLAVSTSMRGRPRLLTVAVHENARHQVRRVAAWFRDEAVADVCFSARGLLHPGVVGSLISVAWEARHVARVLRILHAVSRTHDFLVLCRVASVLACYTRATTMLSRLRPGALVVSSDTNPEEAGFAAAARALGTPTVFIAHAYPNRYTPPLEFDLALLEGDAAVEARLTKGRLRGATYLLGLEGASERLDPSRLSTARPVIGIFAPKVVVWATLVRIIDDCRRRFAAKEILIRWHPSMLEVPHLGDVLDDQNGMVETPRAAALHDIARRCDWAISDPSSNVHLQLLKLGVPTIALADLGANAEGSTDAYGFVANRVVFRLESSLSDLSIGDATKFYGGNWPARFARYDAAYLRDALAMEREAREAMIRVMNRAPQARRTPVNG